MLSKNVKHSLCSLALCLAVARAAAGPFDPALPGREELAAIPADDLRIRGWATGYVPAQTQRGPIDITDPDGFLATFGSPPSTLGPADAPGAGGLPSTDPSKVMSLGDGGYITLTFDFPIWNGPGPDFAVFENSFNTTFLELGFVEVSTNGSDFFRFPTVSLTPLTSQIDQTDPDSDAVDPTNIDGFAGKYRAGLGTPFDLQRLVGISPLLDVNDVRYVRVRDVIGNIDTDFGAGTFSTDSATTYSFFGLSYPQNHVVNDPWPTDFNTGGFDLDAIAALNVVPEPGSALLLAGGLVWLAARRRKGA